MIDPATPATLYGVNNGGVFKSTNGGANWSPSDNGLTVNVYTLAIDPVTPATLYAGTYYGGVFKSTDSGTSWFPARAGLGYPIGVRTLVIDPATPAILYAATDVSGVFKSANGGASWFPANTGLATLGFVQTLVIDPAAPATVYAGAYGGVFKSTNGGATWSPFNTGLTDTDIVNIGALAIDPATSTILYIGTFGNVCDIQQELAITTVSPALGLTGGGATVTIRGWNFMPGAALDIGGAAAEDVTVLDPGTLMATTRAHPRGAVDVVITNPDHSSVTLPNGFVYAEVIHSNYLPVTGR